MFFEELPVDIIAEILGSLDLPSLINISYVSKRFHSVASDPSLNPWRKPILRNLHSMRYEESLKHLSVRLTVPRQNWIEILAAAKPSFILFEATLPNLKSAEWEECYRRRFLPSWTRHKKEGSWKEAFLKILHRVWHRSVSSCTSDEAWTKYIVLNRNGSANELEASSRTYNPLAIFNEIKLQANLSHLETRVKLVLELADVRILALGALAKPRSNLTVNANAHIFLNPPGIEPDGSQSSFSKKVAPQQNAHGFVKDHGIYPMSTTIYIPNYLVHEYTMPSSTYRHLTHPRPAPSHYNYPFFTPNGLDMRWTGAEDVGEERLHWVGGLMLVAQVISPLQDSDSVVQGHHQYVSFGWGDLWAIAPWLEERITKRVNGAGLGN